MNKIKPADLTELSGLASEVADLFDEARDILAKADDEAANKLEQADAKRQEARDKMAELASEAEAYYDERSEKWQESDTGQAYQEWKDRLTEIADEIGEDFEAASTDMPTPSWVATLTNDGDDFAAPGS